MYKKTSVLVEDGFPYTSCEKYIGIELQIFSQIGNMYFLRINEICTFLWKLQQEKQQARQTLSSVYQLTILFGKPLHLGKNLLQI